MHPVWCALFCCGYIVIHTEFMGYICTCYSEPLHWHWCDHDSWAKRIALSILNPPVKWISCFDNKNGLLLMQSNLPVWCYCGLCDFDISVITEHFNVSMSCKSIIYLYESQEYVNINPFLSGRDTKAWNTKALEWQTKIWYCSTLFCFHYANAICMLPWRHQGGDEFFMAWVLGAR